MRLSCPIERRMPSSLTRDDCACSSKQSITPQAATVINAGKYDVDAHSCRLLLGLLLLVRAAQIND